MKRSPQSRRPRSVICFATRSGESATAQGSAPNLGKLLSIPKGKKPKRVVLQQEDIEKLVGLEMAIAAAQAQYQVHKDFVRQALLNSAPVEPGPLRVELIYKENGHLDVKVTRDED